MRSAAEDDDDVWLSQRSAEPERRRKFCHVVAREVDRAEARGKRGEPRRELN